MSCKITTAPINIPSSVSAAAGENTDFTYNYGISPCTVTNRATYLEINCFDGYNKVHSGLAGDLYVSSVRLYKPSLNNYNNSKTDAELIITHSGGGKNVYLCIPINKSSSQGGTVEWFKQIIPFSPTANGGSRSINVSNFSLNDVIPKASFIVYEGGTFDWGCSKSDAMIIFNESDSISMNNSELTTLGKIIGEASYNVRETPDYLKFNGRGTMAGPGKSSGSKKNKTLTCTPVTDQNGNNIESPDQTTWFSNDSNDDSGVSSKLERKVKKYWNIVLGIILGIVVIGLIIFGIRKARTTAGGSSGGSSTSGTSGGSG